MAFFDETTLDRINSEVKDVKVGRALLTFIAAVLYGLGWLAARVFAVLWLICAWSFTAVRVGWQEGRKTASRPGG